MDIKAAIMMAMTMVVVVIMVGAVVLPTTEGYTSRLSATSTNATALNGMNWSNNATRNFTLVTPYTSSAATLVVTHYGINDSNSSIYTSTGTLICLLSNTTNSTSCTVPAAVLSTTTVLSYNSTYTAPPASTQNITSATITYTKQATSDTQGWNSSLTVLWGIIGIVIVAAALMMII